VRNKTASRLPHSLTHASLSAGRHITILEIEKRKETVMRDKTMKNVNIFAVNRYDRQIQNKHFFFLKL